MSTLWKFTAREIRSRPGRALLTLLSVVIGVAMVVSIAVATTSTRRAFREMSEALTGRAALEIVAEGGTSFDQSVADGLAQVQGVSAAVPAVQQVTILYLPKKDGEESKEETADGGNEKETETTTELDKTAEGAFARETPKNPSKINVVMMGIDPVQDEKVRDYQLIEGQYFEDRGRGLLVERSFAKAAGLKIGDKVRLRTKLGGLIPKDFTVVGLLAPRAAAAFSQGGAVFLHIKEAQRYYSGSNRIDLISIVLDEGEDPKQVQSRIMEARVEREGESQPLLSAGLTVRLPKTKTESADEALVSTEQGLYVATFVSLVVSIFIVLNTFLINVAERRRQFAILRAIGATRRQVLRMLVAEGAAMGILGSLLGCGAGVLGAMLLTKATAGITQAPLPPITVTWFHLLLGCGIGVTVSLLATFVPAWQAGRVSPLEGLAKVQPQDLEGAPAWITTTGSFLLPVSLAVLAACVAGWLPQPLAVPSAFFAIIGCVFLLPVALEPLSRAVTALLSPLMKIEGQLAQRQVLRRRTRATLTIGVLFVSLAGAVALGTTIINNTQDVRNWFRKTVLGDFFVRATMPNSSGEAAVMPDELARQIEAMPGVQSVNSVRLVNNITAAGLRVTAFVRSFDMNDRLPLDLKQGNAQDIHDKLVNGEVVIASVLSQRTGLTTGDQIEIETKEGPKKLRIAGVANEYAVGGMVIHMDRGTAKKYFDTQGATAFVIEADKRRLAEVEKSLTDLCKDYGLMLQSHESFSRLVNGMMAGVVGCLWAVLVVGFVVAAFGIVNTLTMNVMEQTRELGLLRVVAMTRRQVRKTIISQAAIMGLIGIGPATIVGLALGYIINLSLLPVLGHAIEFHIDFALLIGCFVFSLIIVVAAAWMPAQRAARLQLAEALQYE